MKVVVRIDRVLSWVAVAGLWAGFAGAQTDEQRNTARDLMDQGDERVAHQDYAAALTLYRAAHDIMNVPTTGIEVARTLSSLGKLVEARDAALEVLKLPEAPNEPNSRSRASRPISSSAI
jgi:isocitrate lyase